MVQGKILQGRTIKGGEGGRQAEEVLHTYFMTETGGQNVYTHPGARVLKCAPPIHVIPLQRNQPLAFTSHSIQAQVTI